MDRFKKTVERIVEVNEQYCQCILNEWDYFFPDKKIEKKLKVLGKELIALLENLDDRVNKTNISKKEL